MRVLIPAFVLCLASPAFAQPVTNLADVGFLVGHWTISDGRVFLFGAIPHGSSDITKEANGGAYVVRDHSVLVGVEGQNMGSNDSVMLIYSDGGTLRAEYINGSATLHYKGDIVSAGHLLRITSDPSPATAYQITYELRDANTLAVTRASKRNGDADFKPFEIQTLKRGNSN